MSSERQRGMTLIELIVAIVIISLGVAGLLLAFSTVVRSSADPLIQKQMLAVGEEMMEEIALKPFAASANAAPAACARNTYNDIFDYHGYSATSICDIDGNAIPALAAYSVSVAVVNSAWQGISAANAAKITVTVTRGATSLQLVGWRTWYACDPTTTACPP